ncbi:NAD(P)H oxidoreductase [Streptomyces bluensis]|uniref:NAD(P)H oxidoreductase n=1 Tax=Streptomyces bluensis TaxID=33897 RepID=UPI003332D7FB
MSLADSSAPAPAPEDRTARALLVLAHPRADSLTAHSGRRTREHLERHGYTVDVLDLHAEGFDPRMSAQDEPDWDDPGKRYSDEVHAHMARVDAADTLVVVFPVWWFDVPAILKGWIDRVWNHGLTYGVDPSPLATKRILWLGLAGGSRAAYAEQGLDEMIDRHLRVGISEFCGLKDIAVRLVYDTVSDRPVAATREAVLAATDGIVAEFLDGAPATAGT